MKAAMCLLFQASRQAVSGRLPVGENGRKYRYVGLGGCGGALIASDPLGATATGATRPPRPAPGGPPVSCAGTRGPPTTSRECFSPGSASRGQFGTHSNVRTAFFSERTHTPSTLWGIMLPGGDARPRDVTVRALPCRRGDSHPDLLLVDPGGRTGASAHTGS